MIPFRSQILDISPYVPGKPIEEVQRELGLTDIIKMASNENPLGPSPRALEAIRQSLSQIAYYPDGNQQALRQELAARLGMAPEQFFFGNGSDEVLKLIGEAYLQEGEEAVMPAPSFVTYEYVARLMGARPVQVPLSGYTMDLDAMAAAIGPRTRVVFLCNPNNPTGTIVSRSALRSFLDRLPGHVLPVLDEAYFEYVEDPDYPDGVELVREGYPLLALRTFSKIHGLAGLRIGYAIGNPEVLQPLVRVKEPFAVNLLAQAAALAGLGDPEQVPRSREINRTGRELLLRELPALGMTPITPHGNFLLFDTHRETRPLYEGMLRRGVILRPTDGFGLPRHLRITIGTEAQNRRFLSALAEVLAETQP